jgi:hypothetical protein
MQSFSPTFSSLSLSLSLRGLREFSAAGLFWSLCSGRKGQFAYECCSGGNRNHASALFAAISWSPVETDRVASLNGSCSSTDRVQSRDRDFGTCNVTRSSVMSMLLIGDQWRPGCCAPSGRVPQEVEWLLLCPSAEGTGRTPQLRQQPQTPEDDHVGMLGKQLLPDCQ